MKANQTRLIQFGSYTREQIHDIFAHGSRFVPQAGTWGLHGVVRIPGRPDDWVFFVTLGKSQAHHTFDEYVSSDGLLQWQSQPSQTFSKPAIKNWIHHNSETSNIHLFLRTRPSTPYWYLGRLAYVSHDTQKERPVYFTWQILDWEPPAAIRSELRLPLDARYHTVILVRRHFLYLQKFSETLTAISSIRRFPNTPHGVIRLTEYAKGTTLAIRWPDLARLPLRKLLSDELRKCLFILPEAGTQDQPTETVDTLRLIASQVKTSGNQVAATKIDRAEKIGMDYLDKFKVLRETQHKVTQVLKTNFPEFLNVFPRWRTKGSLWVLEHYPSPGEILQRPVTEIEADLRLVTRGHIVTDKATRLHQAAERALAHHGRDTEVIGTQVGQVLTLFRQAQDAVAGVHALQNIIQTTGDFPEQQDTNHVSKIHARRQKVEPLRRTGGRYHRDSHRSEKVAEKKRDQVEIACRQYSTGWQVLLMAKDAQEILQNGTALPEVLPGLWLLQSLEAVVVDARQVSIDRLVLIFRLSHTSTGLRGRWVENISRDSIHLLVVRKELEVHGGEPADVFDLTDYRAVLAAPNSTIRILNPNGTDLLNVQNSTTMKVDLVGNKAPHFSSSPPLFIGEFPAVTGEASGITKIITGYEGTGSMDWREQILFTGVTTALPQPPGKLGWFFARFYDAVDTLRPGLDFCWVRDVKEVAWDPILSEISISHASSLRLEVLKHGMHTDHEPHGTRCRVPLGPEYDQTWWRITDRDDVRQYIEVELRVPRSQWALGPEDTLHDLQWTKEPLVVPASMVKPTSTQVIYIAISRNDIRRDPSVTLWVGHNRLAPVRVEGGIARIPLRNLTSYIPSSMEQPLPLQFTVASNGPREKPIVLGQITVIFSCSLCSQPFNSMTRLQQHLEEIHPIVLENASTYTAYYAMARKAGIADELPATIYKCLSCGHTEVADNPHVNNATSAMHSHFNQVHRGEAKLSLSVIDDMSEIAKLYDRILQRLGECSECRTVLRSDDQNEWNEHRFAHYSQWIIRN